MTYYTPISKEQFNDLYRFGVIYIPFQIMSKVNIDSNINALKVSKILESYMNFIYDENILILKVEFKNKYQINRKSSFLTSSINNKKFNFQNENIKNLRNRKFNNVLLNTVSNNISSLIEININSVLSIHPLSEEGKRGLAVNYQHINFNLPFFNETESIYIAEKFYKKNIEKGVNSISEIFNLENKNTFFIEEIKKASFNFRKGLKIKNLSPNSSFFNYAFLYSYQTYYPSGTLGYFYKTLDILIIKNLIDSNQFDRYNDQLFEKSEIFSVLEQIKQDSPHFRLSEIINFIENSEKSKKFREALLIENCRFYIIIPVILKLIDDFNDQNQNLSMTNYKEIIHSLSDKYKKEAEIIITSIGAYFGYDNIYNIYYQTKGFSFIKK